MNDGLLGIAIGVIIVIAAFVIHEAIDEHRFRREFAREGRLLADAFTRWADDPTTRNAEYLDLARKIARHDNYSKWIE